MRGRSISARSRLRSGGYKCTLCGRRLIDAGTLEKHLKTIHGNATRVNKVDFRVKPPVPKSKANKAKKGLDDKVKSKVEILEKPKQEKQINRPKTKIEKSVVPVQEDPLAESKLELIKKEIPAKESKVQSETRENSKRLKSKNRRPVEFECPICLKIFNVYFTAHKHIQKFHCINASGEVVAPNSPDLIQPVRVEECVKCSCRFKSTECHECHNSDIVASVTQYTCLECDQDLISIKSFELHVSSRHNEGVNSLFFPTVIEFTNWRLEMEREMDIKYLQIGEYDTKQIYSCEYPLDSVGGVAPVIKILCPSSMVVQEFSKGIQVHFYKKHGHKAHDYILPAKYKKYCITSFLKNPDDIKGEKAAKKSSDEDLFMHFKKLMNNIVMSARLVNTTKLLTLIDKALEMTNILTKSVNNIETVSLLKVAKNISDNAIIDELAVRGVRKKRRMSAESIHQTKCSPAKRARNKSVYYQNDRLSPKILNTFSLATDEDDLERSIDDSNNVNSTRNEEDISISTKEKVNQSSSFNDSYKDFIDKALNAYSPSAKMKGYKEKHKSDDVFRNKLGQFSKSNGAVLKMATSEANADNLNNKCKVNTPDISSETISTPTQMDKDAKMTLEETDAISVVTTHIPPNECKTSPTNLSARKIADSIKATSRTRSTSNAIPKSSHKNNSSKFKPNFGNVPNEPFVTPEESIIDPMDITPRSSVSGGSTPINFKKLKTVQYEVKEQENDCNILILKI